MNTGKALQTLQGHTDFVRSVAWNPTDNQQLVSGADDGTIKVWDTANGNRVVTSITYAIEE